jgi:hypothetical protein
MENNEIKESDEQSPVGSEASGYVALIEEFQCTGCVCGSDTSCGKFEIVDKDSNCCNGHVLGTMLGVGNTVALGLPRGFNKPGITYENLGKEPPRARNTMDIRFWLKGEHPKWDDLNVPVWAMEQDGLLFVRTFAPRINICWVDVIQEGKMKLTPKAIDVSKFSDQID